MHSSCMRSHTMIPDIWSAAILPLLCAKYSNRTVVTSAGGITAGTPISRLASFLTNLCQQPFQLRTRVLVALACRRRNPRRQDRSRLFGTRLSHQELCIHQIRRHVFPVSFDQRSEMLIGG